MREATKQAQQGLRTLRALLLVLAAVATGCVTTSTSQPTAAVVLVYNIHAGKDAKGVDNLVRVGELIRSTNADIVLLQEVDRHTRRSGGVDQPAELARLTGLNVAFGKSLDYQGGEYGIAVMSRWPIVSDTMFPLPVNPPQERAGGSREPRGAIRAFINSPAGRIAVINTHIDASREDTWRRQEISTVVRLASSARTRDTRVMLGGDLNSTPESAVQDSVRRAGFTDAWMQCGRGDSLTYPADSAVKRIDYLYFGRGVSCTAAEVLRSDASDHRPLLVRTTLGSP